MVSPGVYKPSASSFSARRPTAFPRPRSRKTWPNVSRSKGAGGRVEANKFCFSQWLCRHTSFGRANRAAKFRLTEVGKNRLLY